MSKKTSSMRTSSKRMSTKRMSTKRMTQIATSKMSNKMVRKIGRSLTDLNERSKFIISSNMPHATRAKSYIARKKINRNVSSNKRTRSIARISNIIADKIAKSKRTIHDTTSLAVLPPEYIDPLLPTPPPLYPDPSFPDPLLQVPPPLFTDPNNDELYIDNGKRQKVKKSPSSSDGSSSGSSQDSEAFIKGIITKRKIPIYSKTSDHKPIFMTFNLQGILLTAFSYNMSFVSDLGPINPYGSEKFFLEQITGNDRREYWKNAATLVNYFFTTQSPDIMFFQEMNDRDNILPRVGPPQFLDPDPNNFDQRTGQFLGGFQALLELLNGGTTNRLVIGPPVTTNCYPTGQPGSMGSYYRTGTFRSGEYCFVSFSVRKVMYTGEVVYPTVLTIWKNRPELGGFEGFYGNDIGLHVNYKRSDGFHSGRNFSFVRTTTGANLLNLHCPNDAQVIDTRLRPAISQYMQTAISDLGGSYKGLATVIGGDFNDSDDKLREIVLTISPRERYIYSYRGKAPYTCCTEYPSDTIDKPYRGAGDKIFVIVPYEPLESLFNSLLYVIQLFIPPPSTPPILYGGLGYKKKSHKLQIRKPRRYTHKNVTKHYKTKY